MSSGAFAWTTRTAISVRRWRLRTSGADLGCSWVASVTVHGVERGGCVTRLAGVAVLKCVWDVDWRGRLESASCAVELLYERGAQVPRFLMFGYASNTGTWSLQEPLDGTAVSILDAGLVRDVVAFNELQAGARDGAGRLFDGLSTSSARSPMTPLAA